MRMICAPLPLFCATYRRLNMAYLSKFDPHELYSSAVNLPDLIYTSQGAESINVAFLWNHIRGTEPQYLQHLFANHTRSSFFKRL